MTSRLGLRGLSCAARTSPQPHRYEHKPGDSPSPVPGIRARNIFLHTWNLKSSEMTGSWMSRRAGGGDSARIFCSLGAGRWGQLCVEGLPGGGMEQGQGPRRYPKERRTGAVVEFQDLSCLTPGLKTLSEFLFGRMKKFWREMVLDGGGTARMYLLSLNLKCVRQKMVKMAKFTSCIFYHNFFVYLLT